MAVLWSRRRARAPGVTRWKERDAQGSWRRRRSGGTRQSAGPGDEGGDRTRRSEAPAALRMEKAELLAREDYVNRVNRDYREVQDDNVALAEDLSPAATSSVAKLGVALRRAAVQFGTPGPRSR